MNVQSLVYYFIEGVLGNETIFEVIETHSSSKHSEIPNHQISIFDDVRAELVVRQDPILPKVFTVLGHHKNVSIILVNQMLFKPGDYKFSIVSESVHYLFLFKIPRNSSKIIQLAKQISPYDNKCIVKSYREANITAFGYFLMDFHPTTS